MFKTALTLSVFLFFISAVSAQNQELDSIKTLLENYKNKDTVRVGLLIDLTAYYTTRDINKNLPLIREATQISDSLGYKRGKGISINALSTFYILKGELDKALSYALQAEKILISINDKKNLITTYSNLARIYGANEKHQEALEIQLKNIELIKNDPPSSKKASFYFYAGKFYQELNELKKAEYYFLKALNISTESDFLTGVAIAEGSLGILYSQQGNYPEAIRYLNRTLSFSKAHDQLSNMAATYISLAKNYERLGNFNLALENNSKSIELYKEQKNFRMLKDSYENQSKYYEKLEKFDKANEFLKLHYAIVDTLFSESKVKTIEELQTKYETEKKEAEIASLSQQASIQSLEIQRKNQAIIIGLIVLLFVSSAIYFVHRQRRLKNQQSQTELEQRFLRSQLNPHFIFNALLAIQNFMLKNEAKTAALYLTKFAKLMREILENSRQEFIPVENEIEMLTNYLDIHKLRLNNSFDYKIEINENIDSETDTIPPMFVQPFVENAIEHGIINANGKGMIELKLTKENEYISIEIKDNGSGVMKNSEIQTKHNSLASSIIKERMALFNKSLKSKIQLILEEIINEQGEISGTKVELKVPYSYI